MNLTFSFFASDEDAPEEISVSGSRQKNILEEKNLKDVERQRKKEEKDKRRKKNELFQKQKVIF